MANFKAITDRVAAEASALDELGCELRAAGSRVAGIADVAAGTPAHGALGEAAIAWEGALGAYADAVTGLADAATLAAQCYAVTDATLIGRG